MDFSDIRCPKMGRKPCDLPKEHPSRHIKIVTDKEKTDKIRKNQIPSLGKTGEVYENIPYERLENRPNESLNMSDLITCQDPSDDALKLVIVCVGLPARGKSYITKKLQRYLNWMQYNTKIFNVGNTRRQLNVFTPSTYPVQGPTVDHSTPVPTPLQTPSSPADEKFEEAADYGLQEHDANLFDHNNKENFHLREKWAKETLDQLLDFLLSDDGNVGIFDATNTTKARRKWIIKAINKRTKGLVKILFLESICTDNDLIEKNIHLKLSGPDYKKMDPSKALSDFRQRLHNYEKVYETIDEQEEIENEQFDIQYVKIINAGTKVISYNISGYLSSQCVFFLLNFNLTDRQIWLTANGESFFNVQNRLGGDSDLTKLGTSFAKSLPKFISKKRQEFKLKQYGKEFINDTTTFKTNAPTKMKNFNIWTSTLKRTIETAHYFPRDEFYFKSFKILNDLGCGSFDSISDDDFRYLHPDDYLESLDNKLSYRYPGLGGESYLDVISRLRPIIIELERLKDHVLIVSHRVIIRVLLCYFMNLNKEMLTELEVQHHLVYCIEPKPYGLELNIWQYDDKTDLFTEVDVGEIMKRKRKRGSLVLNDVERLRRLLQKNYMYDPDSLLSPVDITSDEEGGQTCTDETESESGSLCMSSMKNSPKFLTGRTDSQAYEFSKSHSDDFKSQIQSNQNSKLNISRSVTSILSLTNSLPSGTSLSSLQNATLGVSNLKKHIKGSSSDLREQAIQAAHSVQLKKQSNTNLSSLPDLGAGISLSRKSSLRHIKKPSIDWDLFEHSIESDASARGIANSSSGLHLNVPHLSSLSSSRNMHLTETNKSNASSGTSSGEALNIDSRVELIMSDPLLVAKLKERLLG